LDELRPAFGEAQFFFESGQDSLVEADSAARSFQN
jgi:hypothetical protein